jgi:hypothetical protein
MCNELTDEVLSLGQSKYFGKFSGQSPLFVVEMSASFIRLVLSPPLKIYRHNFNFRQCAGKILTSSYIFNTTNQIIFFHSIYMNN